MRARLVRGGLLAATLTATLAVPAPAGAEQGPHEQPTPVAAPVGVAQAGIPGVDGNLVEAKHAALGGEAGVLGAPLDVKLCGGLDYCLQDFEHGRIYWFQGSSSAWAFTDGELHDAWQAEGGGTGVPVPGSIGNPVSDTFCDLPGGGCGQHFEHGSIYHSVATAPARVDPVTRAGWSAEGWERGILGYPTTSTFCGLRDGGCGQHFQGGSVYWSSSTGSRTVRGPVRDRWAGQGWENGDLGYPTTSTFCGLRDGGCGQHFQRGSIYWSPSSGARVIAPEVIGRWAGQGWETGALGYPTSEPFAAPGLEWVRGQHFQGGSVYQTRTGTFTVLGPIRDRWGAQGWERGAIGRPTSDTFCGLRDGACGQHFQGGSIYQTRSGTLTVVGSIKTAWARQGWEHGVLGLPTSDTFCGLRDGGCGQHFQGGSVYAAGPVAGWAGTRASVVPAAIRDAWSARGWENGYLGYPVTDGSAGIDGSYSQRFQGGNLRVRNGRVY
ncbi:hypothetical protein E9549_10700 [Blastococcus sp. MG754426]|uniref:hypothetical protein n=1 Tax=unclassified Blastococcus TaxID=2619396 RepID=UPI001EF15478|nr:MULTISPECIES: hypothetical protein [unclassified Blastococcus]MCF6507867.1 hypothetical protein [Blastococcus sp. MG754426]MCF6512407.1 hypothetical protein [Blastococcus sp. MG754427]